MQHEPGGWAVVSGIQALHKGNEVLVCLDETSKQLVQETRQPFPPQPGAAMAYDYEYERNGVSNLFILFAPLEGWRRVEVTDRRTRADWARVVQQLVDLLQLDHRSPGPEAVLSAGHVPMLAGVSHAGLRMPNRWAALRSR